MNVSLRHLKLVNVIVKEGSLTKAAEKLFLSQPALSHQLKNLEADIGLKVFHRLNKKLVLTEAGQLLFSQSEKMLTSLSQLHSELNVLKQEGRKEIRVTTECYTCYHWLPNVVQEFRKTHPKIHVQIVIEATKAPLDYLKEGKIDLAVMSSIIDHPAIHFQPLLSDEMVVVLAKENTLASLEKIALSDLAHQHLMLYDIPEEKNYVLTHILGQNIGAVGSIQKVQLTEAIIQLVSANLGISVMAKWAVTPFLHHTDLVVLPLQTNLGKRDWYVASLHETSEIERSFIKEIKREFKKNKAIFKIKKEGT
ncbi:LysR family transcriptional regulator [Spongiimicrobium salis]|uniref:LysR family transcriptional regulator n=1 Tax=Spongiimicrobium salis TaxID=1667022 RepID=UPI00374CD40A